MSRSLSIRVITISIRRKNNEERSKKMKLIALKRDNKKRIKIKGSPSSKTSQQSSCSQIIENGNKVIEIGSGNSISIVLTPGDSRSVETIHRIVNMGCKNSSYPSSPSNQMEIEERLHEIEDGNKRRMLQCVEATPILPNKRAPIEKQIQITDECRDTCVMHLEPTTIDSETTKNSKNAEKNLAMKQQQIRKEKLEKLQQTELIDRRENKTQTV